MAISRFGCLLAIRHGHGSHLCHLNEKVASGLAEIPVDFGKRLIRLQIEALLRPQRDGGHGDRVRENADSPFFRRCWHPRLATPSCGESAASHRVCGWVCRAGRALRFPPGAGGCRPFRMRIMSEAMLPAPPFHLPGGYQNILRILAWPVSHSPRTPIIELERREPKLHVQCCYWINCER